ncbi:MAG: DUF1624 domain-containing protein, partial [Cyclobacteriaceae bacterium]|nr:DUF1624 domain-containing protein [Cyclobacteriaceae bacterium HetDA_MAG_MS6]
IGIDVARALAVIGMIIVNFKVVLGAEGLSWVKATASVFEGKAAATFVVLAGVGLALVTNSAAKHDRKKLTIARNRIAKRALFLFIVGLSYMSIWPADILHYYGIYMLIAILLIRSSGKVILTSALALVLIYLLLMQLWDYDHGWDFGSLEYTDFWTPNGFVRNLFFNGFHPVIPWAAFMLFGLWFGKQDLRNENFVKRSLWISLLAFSIVQGISYFSISILSEGDQQAFTELSDVLGTNPMPPLPIYMFSGMAIAATIISACILLANRFENNRIVDALNKTGQLALTFYAAHVIIGMGLIDIVNPSGIGKYSIEFSMAYALVFSSLCVLFAVTWLKSRKSGPLEWLMRKLLD